jgi:hypothetical protein
MNSRRHRRKTKIPDAELAKDKDVVHVGGIHALRGEANLARVAVFRSVSEKADQAHLATGRLFENPRLMVTDADIDILDPMLTPGRHPLRHLDAYTIGTGIAGTTLIPTIHGPRGPPLRLWVILYRRDLALAVPAPRTLDIALPACIVETLYEQPFDPSVSWLRELEVGLAWAWVRQQTQQE